MNKNRHIICFLLILTFWIVASQEIYHNDANLKGATPIRYAIYFGWLFLVGATGYFAWIKHPHAWVKQVWISIYAIVLLLAVLLGFIDLFVIHFTRSQKNYIQTFRLFFQSPVPFVLIYLLVKPGTFNNISRQKADSTPTLNELNKKHILDKGGIDIN